MGFGSGEMAFSDENEQFDEISTAGQRKLLTWLSEGSPKRILDLACSNGRLGELLKLEGHTVIGVDSQKFDGVGERLDDFVEADLDDGLPSEVGDNFDVVIGTHVFERVIEPRDLLAQLAGILAPRGVVMACVPNIAHWYPRLRLASGHFDYERRGIFDSAHVRFFTEKSFERMADRAGMRVRRRSSAGMPVEIARRGGPSPSKLLAVMRGVDKVGLALSPELFSYQFVFELEPK
jgi:SAM-dependent methyltransferase